MPTLPIHSLKPGTLYRCALSGQLVLVETVTELRGFHRADARYFNHSTGQYQNLVVHENQLEQVPAKAGTPSKPGTDHTGRAEHPHA